jgi:PLP dependent protein
VIDAALRARLDSVRQRIADAAGRAGRDPSSIRLIAVSKTFSADHVRAAAALGQADFGENKVQEALPKIDATADLGLRWHLIGHLQSNKAKKAAAGFHVIHSIDDGALGSKVDEAAAQSGRKVSLLVQVDLAGEPTKHGAPPDVTTEILQAARGWRAGQIVGLMLLPPAASDPEASRANFRALRRLRDELIGRGVEPSMLHELSMGMSHDFEAAVEEGATMVRVGTAIFGSRV